MTGTRRTHLNDPNLPRRRSARLRGHAMMPMTSMRSRVRTIVRRDADHAIGRNNENLLRNAPMQSGGCWVALWRRLAFSWVLASSWLFLVLLQREALRMRNNPAPI